MTTTNGCAVVNYTTPTPSDNCSGATANCSPASGTCFPVGTTTVTCTATDAAGNTAQCSFSVTVTQQATCALTCPANQTANTGPTATQCGTVVNYPAPTTSGSCGTVTCAPASGSFFPVGTTTVTCTTAAGPGCSFTVTVNDTRAPQVTCPANIVRSTDPNLCTAVVTYSNATATDNCPGVGTPVCSPASGASFPKGATTVTCTVSDAAGNQASCSFTVTVNDTQAPVITCPSPITAVAPSPTSAGAVVAFSPTATDNCPGVTTACTPPSGSTFPGGVTTVTCTATDAAGNIASCSFPVKVYNVCLQDEATGDVLRLMYQTGEYLYCRKMDGFTLAGTGTVQYNNACYFQMQHQGQTSTPPRILNVQVQKCANYGSAMVQVLNLGFTRYLMDGNLTNNTCICP
jgi:hypothetical protein